MTHRISVVLPVYEEQENVATCLRGLARALDGHEHEIVVVYDFDEDPTLPAIEAMADRPDAVRLVKNDLGRGVVNALRAGFAAASGDVVVTTMADLSDPPELVPVLAARVRDGADVVAGSRYMPGGSQSGGPWLKRTLSGAAGHLLAAVAKLGTHDPTTNFRAYSKRYLDTVRVESRGGFEVALELTVKAHLGGARVDEVPSSWVDRSAGQSRFRIWSWLPHYMKWFVRAIAAPALVGGLWVAGLVWNALATPAGPYRALEIAEVVGLAALSALALWIARALRGRTTLVDVVHVAFWLHPVHVPALAAIVGGVAGSLVTLCYDPGLGALARGWRSCRVRLRASSIERALGLVVVGLVVWLSRARMPLPAAGPGLDPSWEQGVGWALKNGLQWGRDLAFTFGPLGYFNAGRYDPDLFWTKLVWWEGAFKGVLAAFLMAAFLRVRGPTSRAAFLVAMALPLAGHDSGFLLTTLAVTAWILARPDRSPRAMVLALVPLATIGLVKYTLLVLVVFCVAAIAWVVWRRHSLARAALVVVAFVLALVGVWTLCGQSPGNLIAFLRSSSQVAGGYSAAMSSFGPWEEVRLAGMTAALGALVAALHVARGPRTPERWAMAAVVLAGLYVAGRAGLTRHGGNAVTFFTFAGAATFLLVSPASAGDARTWARSLQRVARWATLVVALVGYHRVSHHGPHWSNRLVGDWMAAVADNARALADIEGFEADLVREREELRAVYDLPRIRAAIGDAGVDVIQSAQGLLFLNDLRWQPRPIFQGYYAYTPTLLAWNARFLASDDAPPYMVFSYGTVDGRMPDMDDNEALLVLMRDYEPILVERTYLLLRRRAEAPRPGPRRTVVEDQTGRLGEPFELATEPGGTYLLALDVRPTLLGRLVTTFAKGPRVVLRATFADGYVGNYRMVPDMCRSGVLVAPVLHHQDAWIRWFRGLGHGRMTSFELRTSGDLDGLIEPEVGVRLIRLDDLSGPVSEETRRWLLWSSFDPAPDHVDAGETPDHKILRGRDFVRVTVPSELGFDLAAGAHVVTGSFCVAPGAYRRGESDGVGFRILRRSAEGEETTLLEELLDPRGTASDRNVQSFRLDVAAEPGDQLVLAAGPGPDGDATDDTALWTEVRIAPAGR